MSVSTLLRKDKEGTLFKKQGEAHDSEGLKEFRKQLKPGDILLTKALHPTLLSRLVSARQGSEYGHAALYAGGSEVIDTRVDKGVFETTLDEVRNKWGGGRDIRVYRPDATQGERSTAVDNAKAYIGTPYSLKGALRMLLPAGKNKGLDPAKKDAIVCSQLIVRAYPKLNFARNKDRDHVLPVDFAKSPLTKRVAELSTEKTAEEKHKLHGHVKYQGLSIAIENRKGSVREGVDPDGKPWRTKFRYPYGYIKKTKGRDGEEIDVYIGPDPNAPEAFVVHQHHINGKGHDEDKVMLGFESEEDARKAYLEHYDKAGIKLLGPISTIAVDELKRRLEEKREHTKLAWDGVGSGGGPTGNRMAMIDMDEKPDKSKVGDVPSRDGTSPGAARIERHEAGPDFMTTLPTNGALSSSGTGATTRL